MKCYYESLTWVQVRAHSIFCSEATWTQLIMETLGCPPWLEGFRAKLIWKDTNICPAVLSPLSPTFLLPRMLRDWLPLIDLQHPAWKELSPHHSSPWSESTSGHHRMGEVGIGSNLWIGLPLHTDKSYFRWARIPSRRTSLVELVVLDHLCQSNS